MHEMARHLHECVVDAISEVGLANFKKTSLFISNERNLMKSNLIDIDGAIHHETEDAILFSDTAIRDDAVWLPKSRIEFEQCDRWLNHFRVTMPTRLAIDKGLV